MKDVLVSVVVPIYNVEKYLSECIDSIAGQTYSNIEIVLVNDNTPDGSGEIADRYAKQDERIKVVHKTVNEGLNMARATGFRNSRGTLVTFVDSDDKISLNYIEKLLKVYGETDADITMCGYRFYDSDLKNPIEDQPFTVRPITDNISMYTRDEMIYSYLTQWTYWSHNNNVTTTPCKLFKRNILEKLDWSRSDYSIGEDDFETIFTFNYANRFAVINDQLYLYRVNPESISNSGKFIPKRNGKQVSVFDICHDLEVYLLELFGKRYRNEIYFRVYNLYLYYINFLVRKNSFTDDDLDVFKKYFPVKPIKKITKHKIDIETVKSLEENGLAIHLISSLIDETRRLKVTEGVVGDQGKELERLYDELASYLSIKRSVKLTAGNIKRKIFWVLWRFRV